MTVDKLPYPADLERTLCHRLPQQNGGTPVVHVSPRDRDHRQCAVWKADHYEIAAFYHDTDRKFLGPLEEALQQVPGVYMTTQIQGHGGFPGGPEPTVTVSNPDWPPTRGTARRDRHDLRPQVIALMSDELADGQREAQP